MPGIRFGEGRRKHILNPNVRERTKREYEIRINRVIDFIHEHVSEELSLEKLASIAPFSVFHFHRIFTALTGDSPRDFAQRLRLEKAANRLCHDSEVPLTELAFSLGFSSSSVFARAFKKYFGVSASVYRRSASPKQIPSDSCFVIDNDPGPSAAVRITAFPELHIAYIRRFGAYDRGLSEAYKKLFKWAGPRGLINPDTLVIGIAYDNPHITPEKQCRYDACITIPAHTTPLPQINTTTLKPGPCAVYEFRGEGGDLEDAFHALYVQWLPFSGYIPGNTAPFIIHKGKRDLSEKKLSLDVCLPVVPL
jgi:AraC family transcriptional regulator